MQDGGENATQYLNNLWKFIHVQEGWEGSGGSAIKSNFEDRTENQLNICLVMHGASKKGAIGMTWILIFLEVLIVVCKKVDTSQNPPNLI